MKLYEVASNQEDLTEFLEKYCGPYVEAMGGVHKIVEKPLWRGMMGWGINGLDLHFKYTKPPGSFSRHRYSEYEGMIKTVRRDRKPLGTGKEMSKALDEALEKKFGWRPRSEGLFCSYQVRAAVEYGHPFQVVPIGQFKFVYSPKIRDFTIKARQIWGDNAHDSFKAPDFNDPKNMAELQKLVDTYTDVDLPVDKDVEVSIFCARALLMRFDS